MGRGGERVVVSTCMPELVRGHGHLGGVEHRRALWRALACAHLGGVEHRRRVKEAIALEEVEIVALVHRDRDCISRREREFRM